MTHFWHRSRGIIATSLLVVLVTATAFAGYQAYQYRLPDPETADREGLLKWMVLRDMREQSADIQDRLVDRLENELRTGVDLRRVNSEVSEQRRQKFWSNVDVLLERWFRDHADTFHQLPATERVDYVHETVDDVLTWEWVRRKRAEYQAQGGDSALLASCENKVARWSEDSSPQMVERYDQLVMYIKADLTLRFINGEFSR